MKLLLITLLISSCATGFSRGGLYTSPSQTNDNWLYYRTHNNPTSFYNQKQITDPYALQRKSK